MITDKKADAQQIFMYLTAIIVFSLILVYGYSAVKGFKAKTDEVDTIQLKNDMTSSVKSVMFDYGSRMEKEVAVPAEYKKVCFVDLTQSANAGTSGVCTSGNDDYDAIVCDSWESKADSNMLLVSSGNPLAYNIGEIRIDDPYYLCFKTDAGKAKVMLEGMGSYVLISETGKVSKTVCQNAANQGCDNIDMMITEGVIEQGYKEACCSQYTLCCA